MLLPWTIVVVLTAVVALPERCPAVDGVSARAAAEDAVEWFDRNQRADGRWLYRYDRRDGTSNDETHIVRHNGVTMSLYQAAAAGIDGALELADRGAAWSLRHLERGRVALGDGRTPIGATALLTAALTIRQQATGDERDAAVLDDLGAALVAQIEPSGAVLAWWDTATRRPVPNERSRFFTGETFFALALLAQVDAAGGWDDPARAIARYLATERDRAERLFPPVSDHWAAYGLRTLGSRDDELARYARRLAGIFGVQVRYESQRVAQGPLVALRGPRALGAGLGTLGEGLGAIWHLPELADERHAMRDRVRCVAGMLVDRQQDVSDAAAAAHPDAVRGAWFKDGVTQQDDQQHALSALLSSIPVLDAEPAPDPDPSAGRVVWLAITLALAIGMRSGRERATRRAMVAIAALVGVGLTADALLDAADVSPPTARIAAGVVLGALALADVVAPVRAAPAVGPAAYVVALAVGGELDVVRSAVVLTASLLVVATSRRAAWADRPRVVRLAGSIAVLAAVDLVVDGVFDV